MPRSTQAVFSFGAGVMAPSMEMRADTERYERACRYIRNYLVTPQGGVTRRHGSEYLFDAKVPNNEVRVFTVNRGGSKSDLLVELGASYQRFYEDDALQVESVNPYLQTQINRVQSASQLPLFVTVQRSHPPVITEVKSATSIESELFPVDAIPRRNFDDEFSPGVVPTTVDYRVQFNGGWQEGEVFNFVYNGKINSTTGGTPISYPFFSTGADMIGVLETCCAGAADIGGVGMTWVVGTTSGSNAYSIQLTGTKAGLAMNFIPAPAGRSVAVEFTSGDPAPQTEPAWSYPFVVLHNGVYYQNTTPHGSDPGSEPGVGANWTDFWFALPGEPSYFDWAYPNGNDWATGTTYSPQGRGFPQTVTFHKERLFFGGTDNTFASDPAITSTGAPAAPTTIWGSRVGEYRDFASGPNDDDPVQFTIATQGTPAISWMTSLQGLLVGTTAGNFLVNRDDPITPASIVVAKQNNARSAIATPAVINHQVFSIQLGNRKIEMSQYQREALSILAEDVTVAAEHLFRSGVRDLALIQIPENVLLCVRQDGAMIGLSYSPETQVAAWWIGQTQFGDFIDVTTVYDATDSVQQQVGYVCVRRDGVHMIEKVIYPPADFEQRTSLDGLCYMDSYERGILSNSDTITVPARMANKTVRVTVNDADFGEFFAAGGTVTLPEPVSGYYYVGFSYTSELQTFERVEGNPQGIAFGTARRWNKLYARLIDSALPKINGTRTPDRTPSSVMGAPEPLRNGDVRVHNLGYDDGAVTLEQDLPFPTHVVGLYGQIGTYDV